MIRHVIEIALVVCASPVGSRRFDLFYVLTNGGPYDATEIPTTYLVRVVFRNQEVGYGSAMAVVMTLVVLAIGVHLRAAAAAQPRSRRGGVVRRCTRQPGGVLHGAGGARRWSTRSRCSGWRGPASRPTARSSPRHWPCRRPSTSPVWGEAWEVGNLGRYALNSGDRDHGRRCWSSCCWPPSPPIAFSRFQFGGGACCWACSPSGC